MVPAYLEQLAAIPMTPQRQGGPQDPARAHRAARRAPGRRASTWPRRPGREQVLAGALARTLGVDKVSVDDDFFDDLGANSLLHGPVLARGSARRPRLPSLSMREVYQHPTVAAARRAASARPTAGAPSGRPRPAPSSARSTAGYLAVRRRCSCCLPRRRARRRLRRWTRGFTWASRRRPTWSRSTCVRWRSAAAVFVGTCPAADRGQVAAGRTLQGRGRSGSGAWATSGSGWSRR